MCAVTFDVYGETRLKICTNNRKWSSEKSGKRERERVKETKKCGIKHKAYYC